MGPQEDPPGFADRCIILALLGASRRQDNSARNISVIKGFIRHGGDPTSTGEGGKIYGEPFKDDFRTRLCTCGRGIIAMANAVKDDNSSKFIFTLGSTPDLQNKHTIFGKITGGTIYNMFKLEEVLVDENDRPLYLLRLIKTKILNNPFADIISRIIVQETVVLPGLANKERKENCSNDWESDEEVKTREKSAMKERIKNKLEDTKKERKKVANDKIDDAEGDKDIKENE
ncbi:Peptidyl-prolyl cis-trans isomerase CWC27 like protein [Eufriesea mexicana]|uniref:Peptidyl-prolyl cis-trans isomerase n=1 Tax=Eufriesea mexicana TaxID=516756 RepID=A0A310S9D1_9HYME|nr:Peptidyl-prolyl cis-trans isomerase CWC27 like protein [Eufriesea mexicana]